MDSSPKATIKNWAKKGISMTAKTQKKNPERINPAITEQALIYFFILSLWYPKLDSNQQPSA